MDTIYHMTARCPKCKVCFPEETIQETFGYRKVNGKTVRQSYCRKCRSAKTKVVVNIPVVIQDAPVYKSTVTGTDPLFGEVDRILNMKCWGGLDFSQVALVCKKSAWSHGHSWGDIHGKKNRIRMLCGPNHMQNLMVLLHEYAHQACYKRGELAFKTTGQTDGWFKEHHGSRFVAYEKAAYEEWLGVPVEVTQADLDFWRATRKHRYALLRAAIRIALKLDK